MCENKDIMDHLNAVEQLGALLSHPGCRAPGGDAARVEISSAPLRMVRRSRLPFAPTAAPILLLLCFALPP